jgi:hypothetical protein
MSGAASQNMPLTVGPVLWLVGLAAALAGPLGADAQAGTPWVASLALASVALVLVGYGWLGRRPLALDAAAVVTVACLFLGVRPPRTGLESFVAAALVGAVAVGYFWTLWGIRLAAARRQQASGGGVAGLGMIRIGTAVAAAGAVAAAMLAAPRTLAPLVSYRWPQALDASATVMVTVPALAVVLVATAITLVRTSVARAKRRSPPPEDGPA